MKIKGFTLIELIVVITILAILGAIAFTSFSEYSEEAIKNNESRLNQFSFEEKECIKKCGLLNLDFDKQDDCEIKCITNFNIGK